MPVYQCFVQEGSISEPIRDESALRVETDHDCRAPVIRRC